MKAGFAFMNCLTVQQASQGLTVYLEKVFPKELSRGIVLGYDGRHNSQRFAHIAARVFASRGIRVHLFSEIVPTPVVSFAILHLRALAGVMVTASHNPKQDNGYKVYWENGSQVRFPVPPPAAAAVVVVVVAASGLVG
jgi:phosphomannomutase